MEEGRKGRVDAGRDGNRRGKREKGGRMGEGALGGKGGGGREGRGRSEEGGWERERGREGHGWVVLVGGLRDVLVVVHLQRST